MKILEVGERYTWKNPYTGIEQTGIVIKSDKKNETMKVKSGDRIFKLGS